MKSINIEKYDFDELYEMECIKKILIAEDANALINLCGYDELTALSTIQFFKTSKGIAIQQVYNDSLEYNKRKQENIQKGKN